MIEVWQILRMVSEKKIKPIKTSTKYSQKITLWQKQSPGGKRPSSFLARTQPMKCHGLNFFSSLYKCPLSLALQGLAHDLSWLQTPCNPLFISYKPTYAREISGSLFRSTYLIYNKHQCLLSLPSSLLLALLFLLVVRLHESLSDPLLQGDSNRIFKRKIPSILSAK